MLVVVAATVVVATVVVAAVVVGAVVVAAVVVATVVVAGATGAGAEPQFPEASGLTSPLFMRAAAAREATAILTHGFFFEPVLWQRTTLPLSGFAPATGAEAEVVVAPVVEAEVETAVVGSPFLPLPGGGRPSPAAGRRRRARSSGPRRRGRAAVLSAS